MSTRPIQAARNQYLHVSVVHSLDAYRRRNLRQQNHHRLLQLLLTPVSSTRSHDLSSHLYRHIKTIMSAITHDSLGVGAPTQLHQLPP
jgi:hypothetical protein